MGMSQAPTNYTSSNSFDNNSSDIESATPLGADLNSPLATPQHSEPPSYPNHQLYQKSPIRDTISNSPIIQDAPTDVNTSPPPINIISTATVNHQHASPSGVVAGVDTAVKRKRVTFGPTTIVLIPPRSALQSESQETLDSPSPEEDFGDDLLPFLASNEHPPMAEDSDNEDGYVAVKNVVPAHSTTTTTNTTTLLGAQQQQRPPMGISFSDAPPVVTILKRYVNPTPPPFGESSSSMAEVDCADVVASWVESTPPCSLPSPHGSPSSAVAEVECVDVLQSDDENEEDVFVQAAPEPNQTNTTSLPPSASSSSIIQPLQSDNSQDKSNKQQTSLSKFGFSATASKTPSSAAGQKRPRDKTQQRKKDFTNKQRHAGVQLGGGAFTEDSDSSEYEIEEPIQQSDLGLVNGALLTTSNNTTEDATGPPTTSFSQFELIGTIPRVEGAPTIASTAKSVVVPPRLAWTDDASQDSLMDVSSSTKATTNTTTSNSSSINNSSNNALKAKEANDSFWSKIRSITNVNDATSTNTESKKSAILKADVKKSSADKIGKDAARDTSPVLFGRSNPTTTATTTATAPAIKTDSKEEDSASVLGSPSSSLSALANSVVTPSTTPPTSTKTATPTIASKAQENPRVGRALVCDLCGCAELKGSEGMIIAPIEEVPANTTTSQPPPPQPYNSKIIPGFYVVHLLCALWSPEVYFEESGQETTKAPAPSSSSASTTADVVGDEGHYCGIGACIKRARHIKCAYCRQPGASLGCIKATCQRSYHRQCAEDAGAALDCEDFQVACPHHKMMLPTTTNKTNTQ